ncbi:MAG: hypothetical protein UX28_C0003G0127 [Candidatus Pacebacteria bacterium GW2011_GWA1_46_10]|nr:MAG: hypothetical protein UX28_C0003G0127 [Candidatus Pacebacteria bacterium GW2011_GWA1_46_10]
MDLNTAKIILDKDVENISDDELIKDIETAELLFNIFVEQIKKSPKYQ